MGTRPLHQHGDLWFKDMVHILVMITITNTMRNTYTIRNNEGLIHRLGLTEYLYQLVYITVLRLHRHRTCIMIIMQDSICLPHPILLHLNNNNSIHPHLRLFHNRLIRVRVVDQQEMEMGITMHLVHPLIRMHLVLLGVVHHNRRDNSNNKHMVVKIMGMEGHHPHPHLHKQRHLRPRHINIINKELTYHFHHHKLPLGHMELAVG